MFKFVATTALLSAISVSTLGDERSDIPTFSRCIDCSEKIYENLLSVSEEVVNNEYSSITLSRFIDHYSTSSECLQMCLSINQIFYDLCSDSHIFPNTRLSQIEMEVSSAVKFLVVLRDTRQSENFLTGRKRSTDMVKKYKKHHYENRFRRIEEALDDLKAKLISLERCDS